MKRSANTKSCSSGTTSTTTNVVKQPSSSLVLPHNNKTTTIHNDLGVDTHTGIVDDNYNTNDEEYSSFVLATKSHQEEDDDTSQKDNHNNNTSLKDRMAQVLSLAFFLIFWVANGECLQALSTGSLAPQEKTPFNQPVFITWCSYNFMLLSSGVVVLATSYSYPSNNNDDNKQDDDLYSSISDSAKKKHKNGWRQGWYFLCHVWPGKLGLVKAILSCTVISYLLQILNVLLIMSLGCISVSLSNALYQLQAIFTLGLSVGLLKDDWVQAQAMGAVISFVGVALIVLPPLLWSAGDDDDSVAVAINNKEIDTTTNSSGDSLSSPGDFCWSSSHPLLGGSLTTVLSAAIGGFYLVYWRIFDEQRHGQTIVLNKQEGWIDTHMTLAVIGGSNLFLGWPSLLVAHYTGFEPFQWPSTSSLWWMLTLNGCIEYCFDASCAVAIYYTSPVMVALVSPLTIPIAMMADSIILRYCNTNNEIENSSNSVIAGGLEGGSLVTWCGVLVLIAGVVLMELKPKWLA